MPDFNPYSAPASVSEAGSIKTTQYANATATQGLRFANLFIDNIVSAFISVVVFFVGEVVSPGISQGPASFMCYGISLGYYILMEGSTGRTIGKFITGTKVVREDDQPISWPHAVTRSLCRYIPFEVFSALGGRPWHDSLTKTKVVRIC